MTILGRLARAGDAIALALAVLSGLILVAIAGYTVVDVTGRKLFAAPLPAAVDVVGYGLATAIALGFPYCTAVSGHVAVPILVERFSGAARRALAVLAPLASLGFLLILAERIREYAVARRMRGDEMWMLEVVVWPFWYLTTAMLFFTAAIQLAVLVRVASGGGTADPLARDPT